MPAVNWLLQWWMHVAVGYQLKSVVNFKQSFLLDLYTCHINAGFGLKKNFVFLKLIFFSLLLPFFGLSFSMDVLVKSFELISYAHERKFCKA